LVGSVIDGVTGIRIGIEGNIRDISARIKRRQGLPQPNSILGKALSSAEHL
jgi:hypothetical protein